jgi:hypothetical protein
VSLGRANGIQGAFSRTPSRQCIGQREVTIGQQRVTIGQHGGMLQAQATFAFLRKSDRIRERQ